MKRFSISLITVILVISIVAAPVAQAGSAAEITGSFLNCAGFSVALSAGVQLIVSGISSLFGALFGGAVPVNDEANNYKELIRDAIARCAAREVLALMNDNILTIMRQSGRDGGPAFVRNWRNFQTTAEYRGEDVFRQILSATATCVHLTPTVRRTFNVPENAIGQLFGQNTRIDNLDPFSFRAHCTLPSDFSIEDYKQNFETSGGWQAFLRLSQPSNNVYGLLGMSLGEIQTQRSLEETTDTLETQGHGFTSRRGEGATESCVLRGSNGRCVVHRDILTPAVIIGDSVTSTIMSELEWVEDVDELNELIAAAINLTMNRLRNLGDPNDGELDAVDTNNFQETITVTPPPTPDPPPLPEPPPVVVPPPGGGPPPPPITTAGDTEMCIHLNEGGNPPATCNRFTQAGSIESSEINTLIQARRSDPSQSQYVIFNVINRGPTAVRICYQEIGIFAQPECRDFPVGTFFVDPIREPIQEELIGNLDIGQLLSITFL